MKRVVAGKAYRNIEECLTREFGIGYGVARKLLRKKDVRLNGARVAAGTSVAVGDLVEAYLPDASRLERRIIYEDADVLIIDKPASTDVVTAERELSAFGARAVHRLDTNTTGLMAFARTDEAYEALTEAFRSDRVKKTYSAVVVGTPAVGHAVLEGWLSKDAERGIVRVYDVQRPDTVFARTEITLADTDGIHSVLSVVLHTGRTHQIRAQLAHAGLPVLGDPKYGSNAANRAAGKNKQLLRCVGLRFSTVGRFSYLSALGWTLPPLTLADAKKH